MRDHDHHLSDRDLVLAIDRELPASQLTAANAHLTVCAACSARRTRLDRAAGLMTTLHQAVPLEIERTEQARQQLRAKLHELAQSERGSFRNWSSALTRLPQWTGAGAAAVALVLLVRVVHPFDSIDGRSNVPRVERDALPVASLTPGATWNVSVEELCAPAGRELREVSAAVRHQVLRRYGMEGVPADEYELDYLITPELGGAPDVQNLWPQRYASRTWNAHVKDQLERLLPRLVCDGTLPLQTAQRDIAADWVAAYKKYLKTDVPLRMHANLIADAALDSSSDAITYPVWRSADRPALELIAFRAAR
jgi:hypothetical protein